MKNKTITTLSFTSCLLALLVATPAHAAAVQVDSEASLTPVQTAPTWKLAAFPAGNRTAMAYREMPVRRLYELQQRNAGQRIKATQIGIGRQLSGEGLARSTPALRWVALKGGGHVARLQVSSPDAMGMRVGLQVKGLHPHVELRFGGSEDPQRVVAMATGAQAQLRADSAGMYWSPVTDGATQIIEIYRPAHVGAAQARVQAPQASHLLANSRNDFKIVEKIGESGACNINAVCRVNELGPAYVQVKNAVAHMSFNVYSANGAALGTYICTGTLLNDTAGATQVPWFYSADHCFAGGDRRVPAQDRAKVAASLNTHWNYETTTCNGNVSAQRTTLAGGADLMFHDTNTDAMLLRLREPAPPFATFAGWDASPVIANAPVIGIHHPSGDAKKVSTGQHINSAMAGHTTVGWLSGTTEGGSSGSGLFTVYADGSYRLRGGLHGGDAACLNSGSLADVENRDHYSRLDQIFPQVRQWLASEAVRDRGSQPLVRSVAVSQNQDAQPSKPPQASEPSPVIRDGSNARTRQRTPSATHAGERAR